MGEWHRQEDETIQSRIGRGRESRVGHRGQVERVALRNWKKLSVVLCDKKLPVKLKRKIYKAVVTS